MRDLFIKFRKSEDGASLVEYAVALVVVTIIGGAGVIVLGQNAGELAAAGCGTANAAVDILASEDITLAEGVTVNAVECEEAGGE